MRKTLSGFTLIELIVVVAIVAILAAIAIPNYSTSVVRGNRSAAQSVLMDIAQQEQQQFMSTRSYVAGADYAAVRTALNMGSIPTGDKVNSLYTIVVTLQAGPPPGFTVTATPISNKAQATDGALTINNTGAKTPAGNW